MDKQITTLGFCLKEIYDQIGYTFKSDLLCIAAFINPTYKECAFRDKTDENKIYHVKNRNKVLAHYGDLAIYGILGKLIGEQTYVKRSKVENEYKFNYAVSKLNTIRKNLSEDSSFDKAIKKLGYDKYLINGNSKIGKKTFADIFEGLIGAVAIDSNWNYNSILNVYKRLIGNYKEYIPQKLSKKEKKAEEKSTDYYISLLKDISKEKCLEEINPLVSKRKIPKPKIKEKQNKNSEWIIDYSIKFIGTGKGSGKKKREAKRSACYNMITIFLKNTKTSKNNS